MFLFNANVSYFLVFVTDYRSFKYTTPVVVNIYDSQITGTISFLRQNQFNIQELKLNFFIRN